MCAFDELRQCTAEVGAADFRDGAFARHSLFRLLELFERIDVHLLDIVGFADRGRRMAHAGGEFESARPLLCQPRDALELHDLHQCTRRQTTETDRPQHTTPRHRRIQPTTQ